MFGPSIRVGDWVRADRQIPVTMSDHLSGAGLSRGTRGVVTDVAGQRLTVEFESGWGGMVRARTLVRDVRLVRRGGGLDRFSRRNAYVGHVRLGLALALFFPFIYFVVWYRLRHGGFDGIVAAFAESAIDSALATVDAAVAHPVQTVVYLLITGLVSRWVFRR